MIKIDLTNYTNNDFIKLVKLLEQEHVDVIKEQRSPKGNCLNNLDKFKVIFIAYDNLKPVGCLAMKDNINGTVEIGRLYVSPEYRNQGIGAYVCKFCIVSGSGIYKYAFPSFCN